MESQTVSNAFTRKSSSGEPGRASVADSITVEERDTSPSTAACNYSRVVQNAKTAGDNMRELCNAKRWMKTYLSLPIECRGYQFAQHAHYSKPASCSQPAKKETQINGILLQHKISSQVSKGYETK